MKEDFITVDSELGKQIGFTSDKFSKNSYLFRDKSKRIVILSLIESLHEHQGNFLTLLQNITEKNYAMAVPCCVNKRLERILLKFGFVHYGEKLLYFTSYYIICLCEEDLQRPLDVLIELNKLLSKKVKMNRILKHLQDAQQEFYKVKLKLEKL